MAAAARFEDFAVTVSEEGDVTVVALRGELDLSTADQLRTTLTGLRVDKPGDVVVDCAKLAFIDSAGLSALLQARRTLRSRGSDLALRRPTGVVRRVIELTGIGTEVRIFD